MHDPNLKHIVTFLFVMSFAMMASTSGNYMNICTPLFQQKYNWDTQTKQDLHEALMNTLPAIGTIFGSGAGSVLMGKGRAQALIISCALGIFGSLFTFYMNFYVFLFAKFTVGVSIGLMGVVVARFIEEYVPLKWFGVSQAISLAFLQLGIFTSTIVGVFLPADDDKEALQNDTNWRYIFALQPVLLTISIILFITLLRTDTPRFYITQGEGEKAKQVIQKIYRTEGNALKLNNIYEAEKAAANAGDEGS